LSVNGEIAKDSVSILILID